MNHWNNNLIKRIIRFRKFRNSELENEIEGIIKYTVFNTIKWLFRLRKNRFTREKGWYFSQSGSTTNKWESKDKIFSGLKLRGF